MPWPWSPGYLNTATSPRSGVRPEDTAGEEAQRKREGVLAVAVGIFRHEQIVADQQGRDHRAGGDVEWLDRRTCAQRVQSARHRPPSGRFPPSRQPFPVHACDVQPRPSSLYQFARAACVAGQTTNVFRPRAAWKMCNRSFRGQAAATKALEPRPANAFGLSDDVRLRHEPAPVPFQARLSSKSSRLSRSPIARVIIPTARRSRSATRAERQRRRRDRSLTGRQRRR